MVTSTRSYRMKARAAAAEEATDRILDAAERLFWEDPAQPVTLAAVATLAGVSVHSIIRRFGGQEGMMRAAALDARTGAARKRLLAQLVAICDVYTWFLLRRQRGLTRRETERALLEMLAPLVNGRSPS